jgi:hypothetical protein
MLDRLVVFRNPTFPKKPLFLGEASSHEANAIDRLRQLPAREYVKIELSNSHG